MALAAIAMLAGAAPARAAGKAVIVAEGNTAQYKKAADAAARALGDAAIVDPGDAASKIADAAVVVAVGQKAFVAAKASAGDKPIVFCLVLGAKRSDLARNVTGIWFESDPSETLQTVHEIASSVKRVGIVYSSDFNEAVLAEAQRAARDMGMTVVSKQVGAASEVRDAVSSLADKVDALWLLPDKVLTSSELIVYLVSFSSERRLPLIGFFESTTKQGALASVQPDYESEGRYAGKLAADILAKTEKDRLPVPAPRFAPGRLSINLNTAKALKVDPPDRLLKNATVTVIQ